LYVQVRGEAERTGAKRAWAPQEEIQKTPGACGAIAEQTTAVNRQPQANSQQPTANSQRKETAECKDIKGLRVKKLVLGEATDAETDVVVAEVRVEDDAVSRAAVPGIDVPRPAAQQP